MISLLRRDLDSLERRAVRCEGELQLSGRPRCKTVQPVHDSSSSGEDGESQEQGEGVGEGGSFTSESSGREGESTAYSSEQTFLLRNMLSPILLRITCSSVFAHAVSAVSLSSVREDSATDLSLSGVGTPTLNCSLADR